MVGRQTVPFGSFWDRNYCHKVGPLPVINRVITPINGHIMGNWGYNNYKWCYGPLLISGDGAHFEGMLFACLVIEDAGIVTLNKKPKNIPSSSSGNPK